MLLMLCLLGMTCFSVSSAEIWLNDEDIDNQNMFSDEAYGEFDLDLDLHEYEDEDAADYDEKLQVARNIHWKNNRKCEEIRAGPFKTPILSGRNDVEVYPPRFHNVSCQEVPSHIFHRNHGGLFRTDDNEKCLTLEKEMDVFERPILKRHSECWKHSGKIKVQAGCKC